MTSEVYGLFSYTDAEQDDSDVTGAPDVPVLEISSDGPAEEFPAADAPLKNENVLPSGEAVLGKNG